MGMEIKYKGNGEYEYKVWGKTDPGAVSRVLNSASSRLDIERGDYRSDSDCAGEADLRIKRHGF